MYLTVLDLPGDNRQFGMCKPENNAAQSDLGDVMSQSAAANCGSGGKSKLFWVLFAVLLAQVLVLSVVRQFDHDEFEAVHTGWKILSGERIYIDFFQHHHPFYYYLVAGAIWAAGESVRTLIVLRLISFAMYALMVLITYRFSMMVFKDRTRALLSVILLGGAAIFIGSAIEIRPDVSQTLLTLLSFICIFAYFDNKQPGYLVLSAVGLGASFLLLQKAVFAGIVMVLLLVINAYKGHIRRRDVLIYGVMGAATVSPYYIYLACSGGFGEYFTFNWLLNMRWLNSFTAFNGLGVILRESTLLTVFYILGLIKFTRTTSEIRLGWVSLGLLGSNFLARVPYNQYFMISIPFMAIIAGNAICSVFAKRPKWLTVVVLIAIVLPSVSIINKMKKDNASQLKTVEYVLNITGPTDRVYDGNATFNLFRKDIDFFWYSVRTNGPRFGALAAYQKMTDYHYDIYESIARYRPKVINSYCIEDMKDARIVNHYVGSDEHGQLYVRTDNQAE